MADNLVGQMYNRQGDFISRIVNPFLGIVLDQVDQFLTALFKFAVDDKFSQGE